MKKICITGSSGYLASNFIAQYQNEYSFQKFSLLKQTLVDINFENIDIVLHCAALVHQKVDCPYEKYYEINVDYSVKLAKLAKKEGVKQFVFISSIAVYDSHVTSFNEHSSCNPTTLYGQSKLEAERQLLALEDEHFKVAIIRPPMVYGAGAPGNIRSLMRLIDKVPVLPFGGIKNQRSFVYVGNLCAMIDSVIKQQKSGVFLASDDAPLSTTKLIEYIAKAKNKKLFLIKIPFFETLIQWLKPSVHKRLWLNLEVDNTVTKQKLDFQNPYTTQEGIILMVRGEKQ